MSFDMNPADEDPHHDCKAEIEKLTVQQAGILGAAGGCVAPEHVATEDQWGWCPAYQAVVDLRRKFESLLQAVQHYCGINGKDGSREIQEWFQKFGTPQ